MLYAAMYFQAVSNRMRTPFPRAGDGGPGAIADQLEQSAGVAGGACPAPGLPGQQQSTDAVAQPEPCLQVRPLAHSSPMATPSCHTMDRVHLQRRRELQHASYGGSYKKEVACTETAALRSAW